MQISKHLREESIDMAFFLPEIIEEWTLKRKREYIFKYITDKLETVGRINNKTKLYHEFNEREKKDSCCIGEGIALPHVRTLQCKELLVSILLCPQGIEMDAFDQLPIKIFIAFVAPNYDETIYKTFYKNLSELLENPNALDTLLSFTKAGEIIRYLKQEF